MERCSHKPKCSPAISIKKTLADVSTIRLGNINVCWSDTFSTKSTWMPWAHGPVAVGVKRHWAPSAHPPSQAQPTDRRLSCVQAHSHLQQRGNNQNSRHTVSFFVCKAIFKHYFSRLPAGECNIWKANTYTHLEVPLPTDDGSLFTPSTPVLHDSQSQHLPVQM